MTHLSRRTLLQSLLAATALPAWNRQSLAQQNGSGAPAPNPFRYEDVVRRARELSSAPFEAPPAQLPEPLNRLSFDDYRDIRFRPDRALLASGNGPFRMQLFHLGFLYPRPVTVNMVPFTVTDATLEKGAQSGKYHSIKVTLAAAPSGNAKAKEADLKAALLTRANEEVANATGAASGPLTTVTIENATALSNVIEP